MIKVLVFLADGFEEIEALSPVDYLRRAGAEVITVATGKNSVYVDGAHGITVKADVTFEDYIRENNQLPDAVVVPGGMPGSSNIADTKEAIAFINDMVSSDKLVCAICAAPAVVLGKTEALKNKEWCCYPDMQNNAAKFVAGHKTGVHFVHDGKLITGIGPGAAEEFSMEIVETLFGKEIAETVKLRACQR